MTISPDVLIVAIVLELLLLSGVVYALIAQGTKPEAAAKKEGQDA